MYLALYRKYRSKDFDDLYGQDHISSVLRRQCETGNISHAYLFCGTRGTGKTSTAKIFAKAVNCEHPVNGNPCNECASCREINSELATDVLEIDAASNNGVNNIRDLREEVAYPPSILKKRVYIIDEVHMLSDAAFNALLKTLEEPPEYVVFILCTTELQKIPPTILSRCQRYDFRRIAPEIIADRLRYIAKSEGFAIEDNAAALLAKLADGGMRDAISLLDSCVAGNAGIKVDVPLIERQLGVSNREQLIRIFERIVANDTAGALETLSAVHSSSVNLLVFLEDMLIFTRDLLVAVSTSSLQSTSFLFNESEKSRFASLVKSIGIQKPVYYASVLEDVYFKTGKYSDNLKLVFEIAVMEMCDARLGGSLKALEARVSDLEKGYTAPASNLPAPKAEPAVPETKAEPQITEQTVEQIPEHTVAVADGEEKEYSGFADLLELLRNNKTVWSMMRLCELTESGDTVTIRCDSLHKKIFGTPANTDEITNAVSRIAGRPMKIEFSDRKKTAPTDSINEIGKF